MTKSKIVFTAIIAALLTLILALVVVAAVEYHKDIDEFSLNDTIPDGSGKEATVILLAGQSNASGCSYDDYLKRNVSPEKYDEYEMGYDNVYINYFVSGTNESNGFVKCSVRQGENGVCFGPELGLAEKLNEVYPDETFFIIKYTWGGTNLFEQWLSPSSYGKTGTLYKNFVKYVETSIKYLESKNYNVKIEGMCWMQGESDSFSEENGNNYDVHLSNFIKDIRRKFAYCAAEDGIEFIDAYIADNPIFWVYCDLVNQSKKKVADSSPMNTVIDTSDLITTEEPEDNPDIPHYDSLSELELGHRFAEALAVFLID